jgi:hypothetical protein
MELTYFDRQLVPVLIFLKKSNNKSDFVILFHEHIFFVILGKTKKERSMKYGFLFFSLLVTLPIWSMDKKIDHNSIAPLRIKGFKNAIKKGDIIQATIVLNLITKYQSELPCVSSINNFFSFCPIELQKNYLVNWANNQDYDRKMLFDILKNLPGKALLSLKKKTFFQWIESGKYPVGFDLTLFFDRFRSSEITYYDNFEHIKIETLYILSENGYNLFNIPSIQPTLLLGYFIKKKQWDNALTCIKTHLQDLLNLGKENDIKNVLSRASVQERTSILKDLLHCYKGNVFDFIFDFHDFQEACTLWITYIQNETHTKSLVMELLDANNQKSKGAKCFDAIFYWLGNKNNQLLLRLVLEAFLQYDNLVINKKHFDSVFDIVLEKARQFANRKKICNLISQLFQYLFLKNYRFDPQHITMLLNICEKQRGIICQVVQSIPDYLPVLFQWYVNKKDGNNAQLVFEKIIIHPMKKKNRIGMSEIMPKFFLLLSDDLRIEEKYVNQYRNSSFYDPLLFLLWIIKQKKMYYLRGDFLSILQEIYYLTCKKLLITLDDIPITKLFSYDIPLLLYQKYLILFCLIVKKAEDKKAFYEKALLNFPTKSHESIFFSLLEYNLLQIDYDILLDLYFENNDYGKIEKLWQLKKDTFSGNCIQKLFTKGCKEKWEKNIACLLSLIIDSNQRDYISTFLNKVFSISDISCIRSIFSLWHFGYGTERTEIMIAALKTALLHNDGDFLDLPFFHEPWNMSKKRFAEFISNIPWDRTLNRCNVKFIAQFFYKYVDEKWNKELFFFFAKSRNIDFKTIELFYNKCDLNTILHKEEVSKRIKKIIAKQQWLAACNTIIIALKLGYITTDADLTKVIPENNSMLLNHKIFDRSLTLLKLFSQHNFYIAQDKEHFYFLDQCPSLRHYGFFTSKDKIDSWWRSMKIEDIEPALEILRYFQKHKIKNFTKWKTAYKNSIQDTEKNTVFMNQIPLIVLLNRYYRKEGDFQVVYRLLSFLSDYSDYRGKWEQFVSYWITTIVEKLIYAEKGSNEERDTQEYLQRCLSLKTRIDVSHAKIEEKTVFYKLAQHGYFREFDLLKKNFFSEKEFTQEIEKSQTNKFTKTDGSVLTVIKDRAEDLKKSTDINNCEELLYWEKLLDKYNQNRT